MCCLFCCVACFYRRNKSGSKVALRRAPSKGRVGPVSKLDDVQEQGPSDGASSSDPTEEEEQSEGAGEILDASSDGTGEIVDVEVTMEAERKIIETKTSWHKV